MSLVNPSGEAFLPSERVDLEPLQRATTGSGTFDGHARELQKQLVERAITDNLPRIVSGFAVEVYDQATLPGQFATEAQLGFVSDVGAVPNAHMHSVPRVVRPMADTVQG